ncbi:MAG: CTP synthase [Gammaproteobacteria bacterium AqS3]|nr:CTP synthase [Gammaproteobacteria bacterium AqS3]
MSKLIFVTGGVVSSLGKGVLASSLGALLEAGGTRIGMMKLDPYINVDPGTMNPAQHGEVFVTEDGAETDLDLGHYERFVNCRISRRSNFTAGSVYEAVIARERAGDYLGQTVQVIPHITDEIKRRIYTVAGEADVTIVEIGGTVGDIESLPFLEALRQIRLEQPLENTLLMHLTLVPWINTSGELKTKPTQHSVKELRSIGLQPDVLVCRSAEPLPESVRSKIALFSNVRDAEVVSVTDIDTVYAVPMELQRQGLDGLVSRRLHLPEGQADLSEWQRVLQAIRRPERRVRIAMIGKYLELIDSYKSLIEAVSHAGIALNCRVEIDYVDADSLREERIDQALGGVSGVLIPGGFGRRGIDGKILSAGYARTQDVPYLGICLGLQVAVIEVLRNCCGIAEADSTEFSPETAERAIALVTEWSTLDGELQQRDEHTALGGTMRLGAQEARIHEGTLVHRIYRSGRISERHRHRYEVNERYVPKLQEAGLEVSARSLDGLVEMIEIPDHSWFVGCQFHPEFQSTPRRAHPLFTSFVEACLQHAQQTPA